MPRRNGALVSWVLSALAGLARRLAGIRRLL